jgi:hypothetical protein
MTDTPVTTIRTSFERVAQSTCGLPQYESARALVSVEETFPGTMNPDEVAGVIANQFVHAKAMVFQQLGIQYEQDELGLIREVFGDVTPISGQPSAPATRVPQRQLAPVPTAGAPVAQRGPVPQQRAPQRQAAPAGGPPRPPQRTAQPTGGGEDDQFWQEAMERPDRWTDQRSTKRGERSPDLVSMDHKNGRYAKGLWLDNAPDWWVDPWAQYPA